MVVLSDVVSIEMCNIDFILGLLEKILKQWMYIDVVGCRICCSISVVL